MANEREVSYRDEDKVLIKEIRDNIRAARNHQKEWRDEAAECFDYVAGRQYTADEAEAIDEETSREPITFNRIGPVIDAVQGHQLNNLQDIKYFARGSEDDGFSELYTKAAKWADDESDAQDEVSDIFLDMIICGMGWSETFMSYDEDPDGKLYTASSIYPLEMGWDPNSKKRNLQDSRYRYREKWWQRKEAEATWPKLRNIVDESTQELIDSSGAHDAQDAWKYANDQAEFYNGKKDEVKIIQYQWYEPKKIYRVMDHMNGRVVELSVSKFEKMRESFDMMGVQYVSQMKRTYFQAFVVGDHLLEKEPLDANAFTLLCMTGKRDRTKNHWFGVVRGMKDPQRWANKFFSEMQDFMAANRRGGAFAEADAFENIRQAEQDWNAHDGLIILTPGALAQGKIRERQQINYPTGLDRLMEIAIAAIPDTSGINLEMMGMVDRNQPGVLEAQRKRAAINIIATFFASLKLFQKQRGRLTCFFIKEYLSDGRMVNIIGEDGSQKLMPLIKNRNVNAKYDLIIDEAPHSPNQKEETFAILMQLLPYLPKMGMPPPPNLLEYLPLPKSLTSAWQQSLAQQQPDPVQQAKAMQSTASAQLAEAKALHERASAEREQANIENDQIEAITKLSK